MARKSRSPNTVSETAALFPGAQTPADAASSAAPARPPGSRWTDAQWAGISTTGRSLLVSAAAGSGKTAVLAERCAFLVCDAPPEHRAEVDELLVVTFTEAAAAEMRSRVQQSLRARLVGAAQMDEAASQRLQHQLALVEHAQISTLHGFCARLLRQNFHQLGLDPAFSILDGDEAKLLRAEIAREVFDDRYETDPTGQFQRLIDTYADGHDERLIDQVISAHEMLRSLIDPDAWRARAREQIAEAVAKPIGESKLGRECLELIGGKLAALGARADDAIATLSRMRDYARYVAQLRELSAVVKHWQQTLDSAGLDALAEIVCELQLPPAPPVKTGTPGKELAKTLLDSVKAELKSGAMLDLLRFNESQWREGLARTLPYADEFLSLIHDFAHRYRLAKQKQRVVDFADLERLALQLLGAELSEEGVKPSLVARTCHRRFRHVLVDEYQDINEVQDAILALVSRECISDEAETNLFCVGDVKQSIYRFRLAEPGRFLERGRRFRDSLNQALGQVIDLQSNFRSRAPLLGVINDVFQRVMTGAAAEIDYDQSHFLVPGLKYPEANGEQCFTGAPVELHLLPAKLPAAGDEPDAAELDPDNDRDRTGREALLVAQRIRTLMGLDGSSPMQIVERDAKGALRSRRIRFGDIVVLLRAMRVKGDEYADVLRASGIPVHSESGTGYFESTEVRDMLSLLALLDNQQQDIPLAAVLRSPLAAMADAENSLAEVRIRYPAPIPFHRAIVRYARDVDDDIAAHLKAFLERLRNWRNRAQRRPLAELIWAIYDETGYLAFCEGLSNGDQRVANLIDLHERARQFGSFHRQGLKRFIDFLEQLRVSSDLGQPSIASEADDVVRIMTVHGAKGLEFPVVIVPDLGKRINLSNCNGAILLDRDAGLGLAVVDEARQVRYPSLASMLVEDRLLRQSLAEELRVLYVAMTRAREHLILIGSCAETTAEKWQARWNEHHGPLPSDAILSARCMLDWIGPAWAALQQPGGQIVLTSHSSEEVSSWPAPVNEQLGMTEWQKDRANLKPLAPAPAMVDQAEAIVRRVTQPYAYRQYTTLPAADSVTNITKGDRRAPGGRSAWRGDVVDFTPILRAPRAVMTDSKPTAAEIGSATHAVLQRIDFSQACDLSNLRAQLDQLAVSKLITQRDAEMVDLQTIVWFVGTPLGQALRLNASRLRRELGVYMARPHDVAERQLAPDPFDRLMVRSRIDVIMETDAGELEIVDYKTDRVSIETVDARAAFYGPQMAFYREAMETASRRPVRAVHLVFLAARAIRSS